MAKELGDMLPVLGELLQRRQVGWQRLLANAVPVAFAGALCSGGSAFEQGNQLAAPLSGFDVSVLPVAIKKNANHSIRLLLIGCSGHGWNRGHKTPCALPPPWDWRECSDGY